MDNISKELQEIKANRYGVDIRMPIHDALSKLSGVELELAEEAAEGFPIDFGTTDISAELQIIQNEPKGADVKDAIYSALYKLSKSIGSTNYVAAGLTPTEVNVTPISGTPYADNVHSLDQSDPMQSMSEIFGESPIFGKVEYEEVSETERELRLYYFESDETPFVTISAVYSGTGTNLQWWYQISVYCYTTASPSEITKAVSYPYQIPAEPDAVSVPIITPRSVYVGKRTLLVRMGSIEDAYMAFMQSSQGKLMVSFHCGYLQMPHFVDPRSEIRSFSVESTTNYPSTMNQNPNYQTDTLVLGPIVGEGSDDYSHSAYVALTNVGEGTVEFGTRTFYIEGPFMIET